MNLFSKTTNLLKANEALIAAKTFLPVSQNPSVGEAWTASTHSPTLSLEMVKFGFSSSSYRDMV